MMELSFDFGVWFCCVGFCFYGRCDVVLLFVGGFCFVLDVVWR